MALSLVSRPWCGQAHPELVDRSLHRLPWRLLGVDGELRSDDLDQIGAGERRFVDARRRGGDVCSVERSARGAHALRARRMKRCAVKVHTPRVGAPLPQQLPPRQLFGLAWPGRLLCHREPHRAQRLIDDA